MTTIDDELADAALNAPASAGPEHVYELLALGYSADQGIRTLGLFRSLDRAKKFYTPLRKETTYKWEETTEGYFAEIGNDGVTLYINKREILP